MSVLTLHFVYGGGGLYFFLVNGQNVLHDWIFYGVESIMIVYFVRDIQSKSHVPLKSQKVSKYFLERVKNQANHKRIDAQEMSSISFHAFKSVTLYNTRFFTS